MGFKTYPHGWGINKSWDLAYTTFVVNDGSLQSDSVSALNCKLWYRVVSPTNSPVSSFHIVAGIENPTDPPIDLTALVYTVNATGAADSLIATSDTITISYSESSFQQEVNFTFPSTVLTKGSTFYINIDAVGDQASSPSITFFDRYAGLDETEYIGSYGYRYYHTDGYPFTMFYEIDPTVIPLVEITRGILLENDSYFLLENESYLVQG